MIARVMKICLVGALMLAPLTSRACGELMFNSGRALPFQSYQASRPADVLILYTDAIPDAYFSALEKAGHRIKIVSSAAAMSKELESRHFDVVIAARAAVDAATAAVQRVDAPRFLPIVERSLRKSPEIRARFAQFLFDGASLGQYLTTINRLVSHAP
jgi:signal transduction histidine kinase